MSVRASATCTLDCPWPAVHFASKRSARSEAAHHLTSRHVCKANVLLPPCHSDDREAYMSAAHDHAPQGALSTKQPHLRKSRALACAWASSLATKASSATYQHVEHAHRTRLISLVHRLVLVLKRWSAVENCWTHRPRDVGSKFGPTVSLNFIWGPGAHAYLQLPEHRHATPMFALQLLCFVASTAQIAAGWDGTAIRRATPM